MNGKIDEQDGLYDDIPVTDSLELKLQRGAGHTQDVGTADPDLANEWGSLKTEMKRAQLAVPTTAE